MEIRRATDEDFDDIWPFFREIASAGETYGYPTDIAYPEAKKVWIDYPQHTYVASIDGEIVGSYFIVRNHEGPGEHVCNCGYMVSPRARGKGVATSLCLHSQRIACELGYLAMQFNFVAASNVQAVALWSKLGFEIVGRLPKAFKHPSLGFSDALLFYKWLSDEQI